MSEERTEVIRMQRNSLMSSLTALYPGSMSGEQLHLVMVGVFPDYTKNRCIKDLYYLREKGYVVSKSPRTGKVTTAIDWDAAMWAQTAKGNEVGNELVKDPAFVV